MGYVTAVRGMSVLQWIVLEIYNVLYSGKQHSHVACYTRVKRDKLPHLGNRARAKTESALNRLKNSLTFR